jgi:hypothetical protein
VYLLSMLCGLFAPEADLPAWLVDLLRLMHVAYKTNHVTHHREVDELKASKLKQHGNGACK